MWCCGGIYSQVLIDYAVALNVPGMDIRGDGGGEENEWISKKIWRSNASLHIIMHCLLFLTIHYCTLP